MSLSSPFRVSSRSLGCHGSTLVLALCLALDTDPQMQFQRTEPLCPQPCIRAANTNPPDFAESVFLAFEVLLGSFAFFPPRRAKMFPLFLAFLIWVNVHWVHCQQRSALPPRSRWGTWASGDAWCLLWKFPAGTGLGSRGLREVRRRQ